MLYLGPQCTALKKRRQKKKDKERQKKKKDKKTSTSNRGMEWMSICPLRLGSLKTKAKVENERVETHFWGEGVPVPHHPGSLGLLFQEWTLL